MKCCDVNLDFTQVGGIEVEIYEAICLICSTRYHKKSNNETIYKYVSDSWVCTKCGDGIKAKVVAHPIHFGLFELSGTGKCKYENLPYCPNCEKEPSFYGKIITEKL